MYQRILVAVDGSDVSNHALREAIDFAKDRQAVLRLVHVIDLAPLYRAVSSGVPIEDVEQAIVESGKGIVDDAAKQVTQAGLTAETALLRANGERISTTICNDAQRSGAELIVIGTHGRHGLERLFLGSVAEGVARESRIPILLVRGAVTTQ